MEKGAFIECIVGYAHGGAHKEGLGISFSIYKNFPESNHYRDIGHSPGNLKLDKVIIDFAAERDARQQAQATP